MVGRNGSERPNGREEPYRGRGHKTKDIKQQFSIKVSETLIIHSTDRPNTNGLLKPYLILYIFYIQ